MSTLPPKAASVTQDGQPDGWMPARGFRAQVAPDGTTRLVVNVPAAELAAVHLRLLAVLGERVGLRYVRLTDRQKGQLPTPETWVRMEVPADRARAALEARPELVWHDARHQLWARGRFGEQVVLDELGVLYCYPDDPAFRDALAGLAETRDVGMDGRDYVRVAFLAEADVQERTLIEELGLVPWKG